MIGSKERWTPATEVEQGAEIITNALRVRQEIETVALSEALGRVLAEDIAAEVPQPPFTRSPLDGFAFCAEDAKHESGLSVTQYICAGQTPQGALERGCAARVMTGAPLPEGADCVVRWEDTDNGSERVHIGISVSAGDNVCYAGEDIAPGALLLERGTRLDAVHIGILAGQGKAAVSVYRIPQVAIVSTGDEVMCAGEALRPGKIYDSNCMMLTARLRELGIAAGTTRFAGDDPETLAELMRELLLIYPVVITTGGVSVGDRDYTAYAAELAGARTLFHGLNAKPGSPMLAAEKDGHILLALSGNPFAAFSTFELIGKPLLWKLAGNKARSERVSAVLANGFGKPSHMRRFLRARLLGGSVSIPETGHSSGGLRALLGCNCLIDVPAGCGALCAGDTVEVILL